jgi:carbamate kinase
VNSKKRELLVIALGGNALLRQGEKGTFEEQRSHILETAGHLADLIQQGYKLVITHGNGPQVGASLLRHEAGAKVYDVPALPMDVCVAETQGFIGYIIQQELRSELKRRSIEKPVLTILTRVIIDKDDEELGRPTKPIGPFYTKEELVSLRKEHPEYVFVEDQARGGWRRLVPSPNPMRIALAEQSAISLLVDSGCVVIACGGGGIPVVEKEGWHAIGVEAVVDKDLAGERLATLIKADRFIMLTDVEGAYVDFGTPRQKLLSRIGVSEARKYLKEGHFGEGSMEPKMLAGIRFVEAGGKASIIAELSKVMSALAGKSGTFIVPENP